MKVLELCPYVFIEGHPCGSRNTSGLAYMIRSVCDMLATDNEVRVFTQSIMTNEQSVSGWRLPKRNPLTIVTHFKWRYLQLVFQLCRNRGFANFPRLLLYCLSAGQVEDYICKWKPEVVHIHGIGMYTIPYYLAAARCGAPVVSTLHGLLSFHSIVSASEFAKKTEDFFLKTCIHESYSMTFISSGMKKKVQKKYKDECTNITVIPNCFRQVELCGTSEKNLKEKHLVCVGSIYPLKNQIQVIRTLPMIQKQFGDNYKIYLELIGDGEKLEEWKRYAQDNAINNVTFTGRLPQQEVFDRVSKADLLVFPSIEEGFGIPIAEAYSCGTPVVTFHDLDAAEDIANDNCCVFAKDRSDESLVDAIVEALNREWDQGKIKSFAENFTLETTAKKYCDVMVKGHRAWDVKEVEKLINEISKI